MNEFGVGPVAISSLPQGIMTSKAMLFTILVDFNPSRDHDLWAGCQSNPADVHDLPKKRLRPSTVSEMYLSSLVMQIKAPVFFV